MVFAYFVSVRIWCCKDEETKRSESSFNVRLILSWCFGDKGRISLPLKRREYHQSHIFVSGVYEKNTVNTLFPTSDDLRNLDSNFRFRSCLAILLKMY